MAKYNGWDLPDLPEYDTAAYPRAYITGVTSDIGNGAVAGDYLLSLVDGAAAIAHSDDTYTEDTGVILFTGVTAQKLYSAADGAWSEISGTDSGTAYILRPDMLVPLWANFDVPKADGTVYLAASEPVAEKKFDLRAWLFGLLLGLAGKPMPLNKREPLDVYELAGSLDPLEASLNLWDAAELGYNENDFTVGYSGQAIYYKNGHLVVEDE